MKEAIRQRAFELGFDDCRFTTAEPPASWAHFRAWLTDKFHGEMAWLESTAAKRQDLLAVLPGARSVIVVAAHYAMAHETKLSVAAGSDSARAGAEFSTPPSGFVARYARYEDYHHVLGAALAELAAHVESLGGVGTRARWYADTGPVLERDLAQRAGLGFIGKHTSLIRRRGGNWLLLGEILTTLELPPDPSERNHCGRCTRCLSACPTGAIVAPFRLDARRCISYLTIELKGAIPEEFRPAIGHRIFGCDDCLAVCPWNRFAREGNLMRPHARPDLAQPDLLDLLRLNQSAFRQRFAATPLARIKLRGLRRNVCVALGNVGDAATRPALQQAAADADPLVAEHAAWALQRLTMRSG